MKSALKALSLSLLVFVPVLAHEDCQSKTAATTQTIAENKTAQAIAATEDSETEEAKRKIASTTETVQNEATKEATQPAVTEDAKN